MSFIAGGNNITQRIAFNSATLDFGTNRLVDVNDLMLSIEWQIANLFVLNSIKTQDIVRHSQKVTLTGKIKSFPAEIENLALGSSTPGTPQEIDTLDGQPTLQNPVLTLFDRNGKEIQYQLSGAIFKTTKVTTRAEEFVEWDIELEAKDLAALVYTA